MGSRTGSFFQYARKPFFGWKHCNSTDLLCLFNSPLIWGFWYCGFGTVAPFYYLISILSHQSVPDFLPFSRLISKSVARAILPALLLGYVFPTILVFLPIKDLKVRQNTTIIWYLWPVHVSAATLFLARFYRRSDLSGPSKIARYKRDELVYLRRVHLITFSITSIVHVSTVYLCLRSPTFSLSQIFIPSFWTSSLQSLQEQDVNMFRLDMLIFIVASLVWLIFSMGDITRIGLSTVSWGKAAILISLGSFVIGPGAMAAAVWYWRELVLSEIGHLI